MAGRSQGFSPTSGFAALVRRAQQHKLLVMFGAVFAALWVTTLVPIWRPRFLPLLDLPNHLSAIAIWHRYADPSWGYQRFYNLNLLPLPYWGYFFPVHMLAYLMPIEVANKVYLSAYALALPAGGALLARQMGRSPWLCVFVFPLVFNMNFAFGFITFCAGMTLLLFALVVLDRFLQSPTRGRGLALFALTTFLYTTHVLPWLFFGVAALILLFCHGQGHGLRPLRMLAAAAAMLPSVALGVFAFRAAQTAGTHVKPGELDYRASSEALTHGIEQAFHRVLATWPADLPYQIMLLLALCWVFAMSSGRSDVPPEAARERESMGGGATSGGFRYRLELVLALACCAAVFLPMHLFKPVDLWMIGGRFVSVVVLFAVLLPRGPFVGEGSGRRGLLLVPVVLLHVVYAYRLTTQWREFDRRAASVRRLAKRIPRGSSTLTLTLGELTDPSVDYQTVPYVQFHAYPQFFAGGFEPWVLNTGFPMVRKPGAGLPSPRWKQPQQFRYELHGRYYDYVLIRGEARDHQMFGPDDGPSAPLVAQDGEWRLYRIKDPIPPPPGGVDPLTGEALTTPRPEGAEPEQLNPHED